jgi:hypothetical protein
VKSVHPAPPRRVPLDTRFRGYDKSGFARSLSTPRRVSKINKMADCFLLAKRSNPRFRCRAPAHLAAPLPPTPQILEPVTTRPIWELVGAPSRGGLDCFAALAMTGGVSVYRRHMAIQRLGRYATAAFQFASNAAGVSSLMSRDARTRLGFSRARTPFRPDQARSKRSAFITLVHAATKSFTNFSFESAHA